jgi:hypothetical protein
MDTMVSLTQRFAIFLEVRITLTLTFHQLTNLERQR